MEVARVKGVAMAELELVVETAEIEEEEENEEEGGMAA